MKKLTLLFAAGAFGLSAHAQGIAPSIVSKQVKTPVQEQFNSSKLFEKRQAATGIANKTTAGGTRWYIPFEMYDYVLMGNQLANNLSVTPIWFDSTVRQNFTTGLGTINYSSVAQVVDPISNAQLFNEPNAYPGEIMISSTETYRVDSVTIMGIYDRKPNKASIVDTLIISIGVPNFTYYVNKNTSSWAAPYLPAGRDTLWGVAPTSVDSVNRSIYSDEASAPRIMWKVPMTASMGNDSLALDQFTFEVPNGGYNVPAGKRVAVSFTFKSGDTWVPNVDTYSSLNNFRALFGEGSQASQMPYFYYTENDRNGSSLMFSTDTSMYAPSVFIEGWNTVSFRSEFLYAGIYASCATCAKTDDPNSVNDVNVIATVNAFPNPANETVTIPVNLTKPADVQVSLISTLGQVIETQKVSNAASGAVNFTFNTKNLADGIYFYSVKANGQNITKRIVIAH